MARVAILTLDGYNEIDSFVALHALNRADGIEAILAGPDEHVTSMNNVRTTISGDMGDLAAADAVILGSGRRTRDFADDPSFMDAFHPDPDRQIVAAQCSGAWLLARKGLIDSHPICTDNKTRPWIEALGLSVVDETFTVTGNVATAGGCLGAQLLSTWLMIRLGGVEEARSALAYIAPTGDADTFIDDLIRHARLADASREQALIQ